MAYDATEGVTSPATAEVSFTVNPKSNTATYKDMAVPSATLQVKNNTWTSILNNITFGHFFKNTQDVTITGTDNESDVDKIEYILSEKELSEDELKAVTDWTSYTDKFSINPGRKYVIYAKVTDKEILLL